MLVTLLVLLFLSPARAHDTDKRMTVGKNAESGYTVEASITTVFPTITITPANGSESFCRYTLTGIFESESNEGYYDPRVDYDIANSRVALDSIDWRLEKSSSSSSSNSNNINGNPVVAIVGVPQGFKEGGYALDDDDGDIVRLLRDGERTPFSDFRLILTPNEGANGAQMRVAVEDYEYYKDTPGTVLVLEWSVDAGYPIREEDTARDRRSVAIGGCGYSAGPDADDGTEQPVRCEVRHEVSNGGSKSGGGSATIYQSYVHFSSLTLYHPNVSLSAEARFSEDKSEAPRTAASLTVLFLGLLLLHH